MTAPALRARLPPRPRFAQPDSFVQQSFRRLFRQRFGKNPVSILPLDGDGSARQIFRLVGDDYETAIGVVGPDGEENRAFLSFSQAFRSIGLPVPEIYGSDLRAGL